MLLVYGQWMFTKMHTSLTTLLRTIVPLSFNDNSSKKFSLVSILCHEAIQTHHEKGTHRVCLHGLESRPKRRFKTRSKTWLGSWFELRLFTWATNAFPITIRICALRVMFCSYYAVRARWLTHALMHGFIAHFKNAHARITFRNSFAFTWTRIRLSRRITIQNALFFAFQNAFQKPDLKQLFVHMG